MELGPVSPIPVAQGYSSIKELPADFQLSAVLDVNGLGLARGGSRSGGRSKQDSASAAEELEDEVVLAGESQTVEDLPAELSPGQINYFA